MAERPELSDWEALAAREVKGRDLDWQTPEGITVNIIAPGMIVTPMNKRALEDAEHREWAAAQIPLRRAGYPADIANMAVFLASDAASYCTGSTFYVDGGWMLTRPPV